MNKLLMVLLMAMAFLWALPAVALAQTVGSQSPADPAFSQWLAETGALGIIVSFIVLVLSVTGVAISAQIKRVLALGLSVFLTAIFVVLKSHLSLTSPNDLFVSFLSILVTSQVAYVLITNELQQRFAPSPPAIPSTSSKPLR
jgi:hypothetical protein